MANPVVHFEIGGTDGDRSVAFYREMFDWKIEAVPDMGYNFVKGPEGPGIDGGIHGVAGREIPPYVSFYVQVDDVTAALEKAEALGGRTVMPRTEVPDGPVIGMFTDPDGLPVGVLEQRRDDA